MGNEILVNPYTAIQFFEKIYKNIGNQLLTDKKYKVTREAWITSMFLVALSERMQQDWWLTPVLDKSGSPDFHCYSFMHDAELNGNIRQHIKAEVFEWRNEERETNFISAIKKIKLNKIVDPEISIICYIRRDCVIPPAEEIIKLVIEINPSVKDIWYVGNISTTSRIWRITKIFPDILAIDIDYLEITSKEIKNKFIDATRGFSDSLEYFPTDKKVILTPEFLIYEE